MKLDAMYTMDGVVLGKGTERMTLISAADKGSPQLHAVLTVPHAEL